MKQEPTVHIVLDIEPRIGILPGGIMVEREDFETAVKNAFSSEAFGPIHDISICWHDNADDYFTTCPDCKAELSDFPNCEECGQVLCICERICRECKQPIEDEEYLDDADGTFKHLNSCPTEYLKEFQR